MNVGVSHEHPDDPEECPQPGLLPWLPLSSSSQQLTGPPPPHCQNNLFTHCAPRRQAAIV